MRSSTLFAKKFINELHEQIDGLNSELQNVKNENLKLLTERNNKSMLYNGNNTNNGNYLSDNDDINNINMNTINYNTNGNNILSSSSISNNQ